MFGIRDDGRMIGQDVSTRTLESIATELKQIEPSVMATIETVALENGKTVIVILVPPGDSVPYVYQGRAFNRIGPTTAVMPQEQYQSLLLERIHSSRRWENRPVEGISINALDHAEIIRTVEEAIRRQRMDDPGTRDIEELLLGFGLMHDGHLLNAAVSLFGKLGNFSPFYPQLLLRMARFRGTDKTEFLDNRQEQGNIFELVQRAQRFIRDYLPVAGRVVPNLFERVDDPLYPPVALREALVNAFCHRDYSVGGGSVSVALYDDRLEIASTGTLPFGITITDLLTVHASRPRNSLIAQVLYRRGLIEQWGRGTLKIIELSRQAGLRAPEFIESGGEVIVRFRPTGYVPPTHVISMNELQQQLLEIVAQRGSASLKQIREHLPQETPERTVQDNLQVLRQLNMIDSTGRGRGSRWILKGVEPIT